MADASYQALGYQERERSKLPDSQLLEKRVHRLHLRLLSVHFGILNASHSSLEEALRQQQQSLRLFVRMPKPFDSCSQHMLKDLKKVHAGEMASLKDEYTERADMNHILNDDLNSDKDQARRIEAARYQIRVEYR